MEAYANEWMVANFAAGLNWLTGGGMSRKSKEGESTLQVVQSIIHELTFADAEPETSLTEAGLSSMTTIILVSEIKKVYKSLKLTVRDVINSETVGELVDVIEGRMKEHANRPELALGKRTAVVAPKALKASMGGENAFEGSRAGGASGKMSTDSSKPGAPERRKSIAQIHFTGYDDQQSARSIKSQASRRHSMKSTRSTRSRGAGFSIDGGMPEAQTRRRASVQLSDGHGSFVSRTSSRMSFTIPASGNAASRRNTGMTTVSTTGFARKQGTRRPNNQFDGFTPPRQLS